MADTNPLSTINLQAIGKKITALFSTFGKKNTDAKKTSPRNMVVSKQQSMVAVGVGVASLIAALIYGFLTYQKDNEINAKTNELSLLSTYEVTLNEALLKPYGDHFATVNDLFTLGYEVSDTLSGYHAIGKTQSAYYNMVLRYLYFPRLNIRKNPFSQAIDPTIM